MKFGFEKVLLLGVLLLGLSSVLVFADSNTGASDAVVSAATIAAANASSSDNASINASPTVAARRVGRFRVCTMEFEPFVCPDGKQYSNKCFARNAGWDPEKECTRVGAEEVNGSLKERVREKLAERERLREEFHGKIEAQVEGDARYNRCKQFDDATQRERCFATETGIGDIAREKIKCETEDNKTECVRGLKEKVKTLWDFRFQHLIDSTGKLEAKGVSNETIGAFLAYVKEQALAFRSENATAEQKREIAKNVTDAWKEFRQKALREILEARIDASTQKLENALDVLKQIQERLQAKNMTTQGLNNAISRLEANIDRLGSENMTVKQKWVLSQETIERLKHAKRSLVRAANRQNIEEFVPPALQVPSEVEEADNESA